MVSGEDFPQQTNPLILLFSYMVMGQNPGT